MRQFQVVQHCAWQGGTPSRSIFYTVAGKKGKEGNALRPCAFALGPFNAETQGRRGLRKAMFHHGVRSVSKWPTPLMTRPSSGLIVF